MFTSAGVGYYTLKDDANLYRTGNRGISWCSVHTFDEVTSYKQVSFADNNNGAVLCGSKLYLTHDGGQSFYQSSSIDNIYNMVEEVVCVDNIFLSDIDVTDGISQQKLLKIKD